MNRGRGWRKTVEKCNRGHLYTDATVKRRRTLRDGTPVVYVMRHCVFCRPPAKRPGCGRGYRRLETHCVHDHPYEGENLGIQVSNGYETRRCQECRRKTWRAYAASKRAARWPARGNA